MPMSDPFCKRLSALLPTLLNTEETPFFVYDEQGIIQAQRRLKAAFGEQPFTQYFAVKALPNPEILKILVKEGSGLDCSSPVELELATRLGLSKTDIVFTPNNIDSTEYDNAIARGVYVTFDDRTALSRVSRLPDVVAFRVSSDSTDDNILMGDRRRTKFGVPREELEDVFDQAIALGARRFGLHSMTLANELNVNVMLSSARALIETALTLSKRLKIDFEYINFGGGPGIAYYEHEQEFDFKKYGSEICKMLKECFGTKTPHVFLECGRSITGPHGVLVTKVVSHAAKKSVVIGVDACMSALMRPAIYPSAYHHISNTISRDTDAVEVDIVGALCENNDKFAIGRLLEIPHISDILYIHDCGAHGHSMGFNYNGRLRPAEYLLNSHGKARMIRRAETINDYLSTVAPSFGQQLPLST